MPDIPLETPKILALYLQIAQYPILARQIRQRMREELHRRGVIDSAQFEQEARTKAIDIIDLEELPALAVGNAPPASHMGEDHLFLSANAASAASLGPRDHGKRVEGGSTCSMLSKKTLFHEDSEIPCREDAGYRIEALIVAICE